MSGTPAGRVAIIGGGAVGSSIAWHLLRDGYAGPVTVIERDPAFARASSYRATGGIRQQYASSENVAMARHSVAFLRTFDETMRVNGESPGIWFRERGYLFLASRESAPQLDDRFAAMRASGARVERLYREDIARRWPCLLTDDIAFGVLGPEDGYLDPRRVASGFRRAAAAAGAELVDGAEVVGIEATSGRTSGVMVREQDGSHRRIAADWVVNAAGAWAGAIGKMADIRLPIVPVRQHLFRLELGVPLAERLPMVFDPDGTHWRHDDPLHDGDGERLIVGRSRPDEPPGENFECDYARLDAELLPVLGRRMPSLGSVRPVEGWAGLYEMTPDHNALLGEHPALAGFVVAAGFSGHGLMMSPATGHAMSELVRRGRCTTFDIARFAPDRFDRGERFEDAALV